MIAPSRLLPRSRRRARHSMNNDTITPSQNGCTSNSKSTMTRSSSSTRVSRSPSRSSVSPNTIPRALRLLRLLLYSIAAPNFIYSMYVQLIVLKGPGRSPLPASVNFGRDSLFLTFHGNFHCTWYACLCLLNSFLSLGPLFRRKNNNNNNNNIKYRKRKSYAANIVEKLSHRCTSILFPLAMFVGLAYYLILHFHPLNRLRAKLVPDHDSKMALLHFNPALFMVFDSWLKDSDLLLKHGLKQRKASNFIMIYGIIYFLWTAFCVKMNGGHWPYPFQKSFSVVQHIMFVLCSVLFSAYLCRTGFRLHGRLDRRRRRRLSAALERSSSSNTLTTTTTTNNNNNTNNRNINNNHLKTGNISNVNIDNINSNIVSS